MNAVQATVTVPVDQQTAFAVFTAEIDAWYVRGPHSWVDQAKAVGIRFVDGYLRELWSDGGHVDVGRVIAWEPPHRLAWADLLNDGAAMEIEVVFTPDGDGTSVTLEHRGLDTLPPEVERRIRRGYSWNIALRWYAEALNG
ncbi:SRPBCC domain-containing protein [Nonomuraea sp. NPDC050556]|uniref:SRPBCC domain-containing protein n=1 Tax=Nonomuraea sp. NPDC050556 TaxID=3364369 RepID=UPI0037971A1F